MLRRFSPPGVTATTALTPCSSIQKRFERWASANDALAPIAGQEQGTLGMLSGVCANPDEDEERRRPAWRHEVRPKQDEHSYLATMYRWGHDSLSLVYKFNESPGPWYNANNATTFSVWTQIAEYGSCATWSGVLPYTFGCTHHNKRPSFLHKMSWGRKDKNGAIRINYGETIKQPAQEMMFPHSKEHLQHKRYKNPPNKNVGLIDSIHGKRVLREVQYHIGGAFRVYMVDGYFGSSPESSTAYRFFTDNATHAYILSAAAIRQKNVCDYPEVCLTKRVDNNPLDEMAWRRPGVIMYHAPGFDFEIPRIVEEFGGPRPQDMGLEHPKFIITDPYSIPMKSIIAAEPSMEVLFRNLAFLCARWGYYADDRCLLTIPSDSVISPDSKRVTVVIDTGDAAAADLLRSSKLCYGAHHHRIAANGVTRAWDVTAMNAASAGQTAYGDVVEEEKGKVLRPLPNHVGNQRSLNHRLLGRRDTAEWGYKFPHNYTEDPKTRAAASGMLFNTKGISQGQPRPALMNPKAVQYVIAVEGGAGLQTVNASAAAKLFVQAITDNNWLYAEPEKLIESFTAQLTDATVYTVGKKNLQSVAQALATTGALPK